MTLFAVEAQGFTSRVLRLSYLTILTLPTRVALRCYADAQRSHKHFILSSASSILNGKNNIKKAGGRQADAADFF